MNSRELRDFNAELKTLTNRASYLIRAAYNRGVETAAKVAGNTKGGYTANIRTSRDEQEFSKDKDGPWVLNADVAKAIRAKKIFEEESGNGKT
jgi:hypothetical protein